MKKGIVIIAFIAIFTTSMIAAGVENGPSGYVGSSACQPCHSEAFDSWKSSKHASEFNLSPDSSVTCRGCHTTGMDALKKTSREDYVGCEACHGPGREHMDSGGDTEKIVSTDSADICGRCHSGSQPHDNGQWMAEYRPGMKLSDMAGLKLIPVDPEKIPPPVKDVHPSLTYNMWLVSGHGKAPDREIKIGDRDWAGPISCVACHNPHYSSNPFQLISKPEDLCVACHSQDEVQKGKGAKGIEETRNLHTPTPCISCHMTEENHLMKVLRPDDPDLAEGRTDSCTVCHLVGSREERAGQIQDWEAWYKETFDPLQADLKKVEIAVGKNPDLLDAEMKAKLGDIKANLSIIIKDGSNGVHNLDYALEIMALAKRDLKKIKKAME